MYLLFDIGGTKTRVAFSDGGDSFEEPIVISTPQDYAEGLETFKRLAAEASHGRPIEAVVGGIAGPFSERKESLVTSPNLKGWINKPFLRDLHSHFHCPVHIENDSAMVGLGEANFGAGRGFPIVAYMTVSTGVGGARIVNGKVDEKSVGFEIGHQIIDADMTLDKGIKGKFLEYYISGKWVEERTGKKPKDIADEAYWDTLARYLAYGLNNTIVHWSPDVVVLGGSMITGDPAIPIAKVVSHLKEFFLIFPELPAIKMGELRDFGGLWGALSYLKQDGWENR